MSKLKHYEGDGWEVKVKYDEEMVCTVWKDRKGVIPPSKYYNIVDSINDNCQGIYFDYMLSFNHLIEHLDNLTAPKIINEREFENDNFHIKVWETEDKIGAETVRIREGFEYGGGFNLIINDKYKTDFFVSPDVSLYPNFGTFVNSAEIYKTKIKYTFTDLCKALERAEQETSELTYDTVVKELDGLEGRRYLEQLTKYEYCIGEVNLGSETIDFKKAKWFNLRWFGSMHKEGRLAVLPYNINLDYLGRCCKRGLIKLRRVK